MPTATSPSPTAYLPDDASLRALLIDAGFRTVGRQLLQGVSRKW